MYLNTRKLKAVLGAASALSLMIATGALADGNFSNVTQDGSNNSGLVTQGGSTNKVGRVGLAARQEDNRNTFTFSQSGVGNEIGTGATGFRQHSNRNLATITQSTGGNRVDNVDQKGSTATPAQTRNTLTITQEGGDGNIVESVSQERGAGVNLPFVGPVDIAASNVATVRQNGGSNRIVSLSQEGWANNATVNQTQSWNHVGAFSQDGLTNTATVNHIGINNVTNMVDQRGELNGASITLSGSYNGYHDPAAAAWPTGHGGLDAVFNGLGAATVWQNGTLNAATLTAIGSRNMYHFEQNGTLNIASGVLTGDDNAAAIRQNGSLLGNLASYVVTGHRNHVFIGQTSGPNFGTITIDGNDNHQALLQEGIGNLAALDVTGNGNIQQAVQTGNDNSLDVTVVGNNNNSGSGFTSPLPAWSAAGDVVQTGHLTSALIPGQIFQLGNSNSITHQVGSLGNPADNNKYAFYQSGNGNSIDGNTQGNNNEAAIVQIGNGNHTSFSQIGSGNVIGVSQ